MHKPKNGFKGFVENWQADLKAGFVVSLVALPISIALSLASGAPAIAGLIAAVIGGILVAHLGGSYVTIIGPRERVGRSYSCRYYFPWRR